MSALRPPEPFLRKGVRMSHGSELKFGFRMGTGRRACVQLKAMKSCGFPIKGTIHLASIIPFLGIPRKLHHPRKRGLEMNRE